MKKHLRKLPLFASLFLLFSMSCSKQDTPVIIEESAIFTLVTSEFTPGDNVEIKSNKALLSSDIDVVLNNTSIKAYKISDYSYIFTLPVIPSGKYDLKLPTINKDLFLNLTVKTYTPIANPTEVIAGYVLTRNKCFDEMSKNTSVVPFKTSPETLQMIDQIKQEWDFQFNKSSAKEKELLAYVLQKQEISADWFNFPNDVPASYFAKTNGVQNDVGDKLVTYAKTYITAQVVCVKAIPATLGTGAVFLIAPNPITAGFFLISFTTFIVSREVAERNAVAVGSLKGVAEAVTDFSFQKTAALELVNNFEKNISMSVNFRNLKSTDAAIQSDISAAFTGENELVAKDNEVKALYQKVTSFAEKLKGLFRSYNPAIGKTSERSLTAVVVGNDIIIKSSSDANVTVTSKMVGTNRVIKASSTSTTDINFNLKVAYKRKIDGKEVEKDIACVLKKSFAIGITNVKVIPKKILPNETSGFVHSNSIDIEIDVTGNPKEFAIVPAAKTPSASDWISTITLNNKITYNYLAKFEDMTSRGIWDFKVYIKNDNETANSSIKVKYTTLVAHNALFGSSNDLLSNPISGIPDALLIPNVTVSTRYTYNYDSGSACNNPANSLCTLWMYYKDSSGKFIGFPSINYGQVAYYDINGDLIKVLSPEAFYFYYKLCGTKGDSTCFANIAYAEVFYNN
jgi:hypothetical protein